jgi:hypothetical protein
MQFSFQNLAININYYFFCLVLWISTANKLKDLSYE